ncbi:FtsW/RodA/SpoVE family cell cycle protein [Paenibacillus alvei]
MTNLKESFLLEVMQYIKSKDAKEAVRKELSYHLKMSQSELIGKGATEKEAEQQAIKQMGSPIELGSYFNKLYRPLFDWKLFCLFTTIILIGILPLLHIQADFSVVSNQIMFIILGIFIALSVMLFDYRKIKNFGWLILITGFVLLLALNFFPSTTVNGLFVIRFLSFTISGASLLPVFLVFWAIYLSKDKPKRMVVISIYLLSFLLFVGLANLTDIFLYSLLVLTLIVASSVNNKTLYPSIGVSLGLLLTFVILFFVSAGADLKRRILSFLHPEKYAENEGYIYLLLKDIRSSGGWFGNSSVQFNQVEMSTDLVLANITYYYGWIVASLVFVIILLLVWRMIVLSTQIKDKFGKLLILGVCSLLSVQFIYNIGMILGLVPVIYMSLPFISYGLTPTVLNSLLIGIVLSVYRRKNLVLTS